MYELHEIRDGNWNPNRDYDESATIYAQLRRLVDRCNAHGADITSVTPMKDGSVAVVTNAKRNAPVGGD